MTDLVLSVSVFAHVQVHDCGRGAAPSTQTAAETARAEQEIQQHRCIQPPWSQCRNWGIYTVLAHKTSCKVRHGIRTRLCYTHADWCIHFHVVDMCCCGLALQCSRGWETTSHVEFTTTASNTEDQGAAHSDSEVRLPLTQGCSAGVSWKSSQCRIEMMSLWNK